MKTIKRKIRYMSNADINFTCSGRLIIKKEREYHIMTAILSSYKIDKFTTKERYL